MNRTQTACFALLASAFVLAAILVIQLDRKAEANAAHADGQNVLQTTFQMMTARTRGNQGGGDESLFILDNTKGVLIVYVPNIPRERLEPVTAIKMDNIFGGGGGGGGR